MALIHKLNYIRLYEVRGKAMTNVNNEDTLLDIIQSCPKNQVIIDNLVRAWAKINSSKYHKILCSISGGVIQI